MYLPIRPTKNQAFRLYLNTYMGNLGTNNSDPSVPPPSFAQTAFAISKDGGSYIGLTNTPVEVSTGKGYIDLTAAEMNADVIVISLDGFAGAAFSNGKVCKDTVTIYTTTGSSSLTAQEVWEYATRELTATGAGISLDDVIDEVEDLPAGDLTVRQVLQVIMKRLKRNKRTPKL